MNDTKKWVYTARKIQFHFRMKLLGCDELAHTQRRQSNIKIWINYEFKERK